MNAHDSKQKKFITNARKFCYKVMPLGIKNRRVMYHRMMDKVFKSKIGDVLEVYKDDMIFKSKEEDEHRVYLEVYSTKLGNTTFV